MSPLGPPSPPPHPRRRLTRRLRRRLLAHRRPLAALCAGLAVLAALQAQAAPPPPRTTVLVAAHDLGGGTVLRASDLARADFDPASVPSGVLGATAAVGRTTAGPVRAGEPLTDVRLVSESLLAGYPGSVAAPVRVGDPGAVRLLRVGDRVDLLAADPEGGREAEVLATDAPVIALPRGADSGTDLVSGGLVVVAVPAPTARVLAAAGVRAFLSVTISR